MRKTIMKKSMQAVPTLIAGAVAALAFGTATAQADSSDQAFLTLLARKGISCTEAYATCSNGQSDLIQMGHAICSDLRRGRDPVTEVESLTEATHGNLNNSQVAYMVGASISAYCPDLKSLVQ
jgi:hypothetical protein